MIQSLLGKKNAQSQTFTDDGKRIPVTTIEAGPCTIVDIRTNENKQIKSIQLGFGLKALRHTTKPVLGHVKKAGLGDKPPLFLRNIIVHRSEQDAGDQIKVGSTISVADVFAAGDRIQVTGVSKGKGFAGVVKRHGFRGGPRTHGQSDRERAPGAIGQTTTPGRVYKGKRMAGRMGNDQVTVKNLLVVAVDQQNNRLIIKGLVPGARKSLLTITKLEGKKTN